jgi:hypothetical protein
LHGTKYESFIEMLKSNSAMQEVKVAKNASSEKGRSKNVRNKKAQ